MRTTRPSLHRFAAAFIAMPLMMIPISAIAGRTQTEYSGGAGDLPPSGFGPAGDAWVTSNSNCAASTGASSCSVAFGNGTSSSLIGLGFATPIKIGGDTYDSIYINSSGFLTFANASAPGTAYTDSFSPAISSITALGTEVGEPFIAPFYADLGITSLTNTPFTATDGGALFFRGSAIPTLTSSSTTADLVPAFAATWFSDPFAATASSPQIATQVVFYSIGSTGDFDMRLRYGSDLISSSDVTYTGGLSGFSLGGTTMTVTPTSSGDAFFSFVGGVFSSGGSTGGGGGIFDAPEIDPSAATGSLTLLLGGLLILSSSRRLRTSARRAG